MALPLESGMPLLKELSDVGGEHVTIGDLNFAVRDAGAHCGEHSPSHPIRSALLDLAPPPSRGPGSPKDSVEIKGLDEAFGTI